MTIILIIASLSLNGLISISAHPAATLDQCRSVGDAAINALTATAAGGGLASYVCHDATKKGFMTVIANVSPTDGKIEISEGVFPTGEECEEKGKFLLKYKIVPGAMSWSCFQIPGS